jgi:protein TonB
VEDIIVIDEDPAGYFSTAAIRAASRFRYKPRMLNGQPVAVTGVRNRIVFRIAEGG